MPRTKSIVRSTKRQRTSRSKSVRPSRGLALRTIAVANPSVGLGASCVTVLRTSFFANCNSPATGVFTGFLKPGSCFDPCGDQAVIQPSLFDQFAAVYQRYKVNKAQVRLTVTGIQVNAGGGAWVMAAYPAVDSTALATYQAAGSQYGAKTISGSFQMSAAVGVGAEPKHVRFDLNHDAVVGSKSDAYDSGALVTADPTSNQYMVMPFLLQGSIAANCIWVIEVDIFQTVTFSQRKNVVDA